MSKLCTQVHIAHAHYLVVNLCKTRSTDAVKKNLQFYISVFYKGCPWMMAPFHLMLFTAVNYAMWEKKHILYPRRPKVPSSLAKWVAMSQQKGKVGCPCNFALHHFVPIGMFYYFLGWCWLLESVILSPSRCPQTIKTQVGKWSKLMSRL